jgi:hypothetical protein
MRRPLRVPPAYFGGQAGMDGVIYGELACLASQVR